MVKLLAGIDEAGRGAVLGPLVVAGVLFKDEKDIFDILSVAGVRDSKLLTAEHRRELARLVSRLAAGQAIFRIAPARLDEYSLNKLEIHHTARLIDKLKPQTVYLDVPASGRGIARYCDAVKGLCLGQRVEIKGGNKFDTNNIIVAAASILAKEARERAIRGLHKKYGDFGSGYPSDPRTREWLRVWRKKNRDWPGIVRTKWATISDLRFRI